MIRFFTWLACVWFGHRWRMVKPETWTDFLCGEARLTCDRCGEEMGWQA